MPPLMSMRHSPLHSRARRHLPSKGAILVVGFIVCIFLPLMLLSSLWDEGNDSVER